MWTVRRIELSTVFLILASPNTVIEAPFRTVLIRAQLCLVIRKVAAITEVRLHFPNKASSTKQCDPMDRLLLRSGRLRTLHSTLLSRPARVYAPCRHNVPRTSLRVRGYADTTASSSSSSSQPDSDPAPAAVDAQPKKPYYVTTPIFYVNAGKTCCLFVAHGGQI